MAATESEKCKFLIVGGGIAGVTRADQTVCTEDGRHYEYEKLCICAGARPKLITHGNPHVLGIRDRDSAQVFQKRLSSARRIAVVGNGGIALELVYEIEGCEMIWAVKDKAMGNTFFDAGAAQFLVPQLESAKPKAPAICKRTKYSTEGPEHQEQSAAERGELGSALGPDWHEGIKLKGTKEVIVLGY
ncbi:Pyridine nucleotide-disulfide oxidoreductase domain-containing protein 1 [Acipenser ruthenus]|uniref:Pyridine nucleotide-disulfide oxidoreductase domain-containing protein 1 n=1 Tax=Acipenser ruthenus TaxID=7906 RepID=A0A662YSQ8_ACIRT|nr:Pyridine nucleotide-disulfide oxidoreductase domain-containing protein 1 [Acipenser ruthenus]